MILKLAVLLSGKVSDIEKSTQSQPETDKKDPFPAGFGLRNR